MSQAGRSTTKRVMDQPPPGAQTPIVTCAGPLRRGPAKAGGGHSHKEDGVGGGAVFTFKVGLRIADR